jgi:hypothetical protein
MIRSLVLCKICGLGVQYFKRGLSLFRNMILIFISLDILALLIRAQNSGFIIRMLEETVVFESFEVSLPNEIVMRTSGKLTRPRRLSRLARSPSKSERRHTHATSLNCSPKSYVAWVGRPISLASKSESRTMLSGKAHSSRGGDRLFGSSFVSPCRRHSTHRLTVITIISRSWLF